MKVCVRKWGIGFEVCMYSSIRERRYILHDWRLGTLRTGPPFFSIRALGSFEEGDLLSAREYVDTLSDSHHPNRDPEVFPLW